MAKQNTKGMSTGEMVGAGVTAGALALAGYLMFGPDAKKNRKVVKGWAVKMKGEIIEKLEEAKDITEPTYNKIVDTVVAKYAKAKSVDSKELEVIVADIKKHWKAVTKSAQPKKKAAKGKGKK
jgi:hypothetical protein